MSYMKPVKVKLLRHGGYDGLKGVEFPVEVTGKFNEYIGYIDVPMCELVRIGYDKEKGQVAEVPDCKADSMGLTFFQGTEAVIID